MVDNLTTFMCRLSWNLTASTSWNPQGLSGPVMGLHYLYLWVFNPMMWSPTGLRALYLHLLSTLLLCSNLFCYSMHLNSFLWLCNYLQASSCLLSPFEVSKHQEKLKVVPLLKFSVIKSWETDVHLAFVLKILLSASHWLQPVFVTNTDRLIVFREIICLVVCLWESHETIPIIATRRVRYLYSRQCTYLLQGCKSLGPFLYRDQKNIATCYETLD